MLTHLLQTYTTMSCRCQPFHRCRIFHHCLLTRVLRPVLLLLRFHLPRHSLPAGPRVPLGLIRHSLQDNLWDRVSLGLDEMHLLRNLWLFHLYTDSLPYRGLWRKSSKKPLTKRLCSLAPSMVSYVFCTKTCYNTACKWRHLFYFCEFIVVVIGQLTDNVTRIFNVCIF